MPPGNLASPCHPGHGRLLSLRSSVPTPAGPDAARHRHPVLRGGGGCLPSLVSYLRGTLPEPRAVREAASTRSPPWVRGAWEAWWSYARSSGT